MRLALTPAPLPSGEVSLRRLELAVVLHPEEPARLPSPKPRIDAARGEERAVRALLLDAPLVEDDEPVERRDGREPVGDGDHRLAFHERRERLLDRGLDLRVEGGCRLVEDEDRRVLEDHPCDRDALALPAGELDAALADMRLVAVPAFVVLELQDEVMRMGEACRTLDLLARRFGAPVSDVVADRTVQERGVLRDDCDLPPQ